MRKSLLVVIMLLLISSSAHAQGSGVLYFSAQGVPAIGNNFTVTVTADPKGQMLDTVRAAITFSQDTLQVKSVTLGSAFSVADPDNSYDNSKGIISYAGGVPGGTNQATQFAAITFTVKKSGPAAIAFSNESIMLSGGTNILAGLGNGASFTIAESTGSAPSGQYNATDTDLTPSATQLKTAANPTSSPKQEKDVLASPAAIQESGIVPIVAASSSQAWGYVAQNKWFVLFWLLLAMNIILLLRKKGAAIIRVFPKKHHEIILLPPSGGGEHHETYNK